MLGEEYYEQEEEPKAQPADGIEAPILDYDMI